MLNNNKQPKHYRTQAIRLRVKVEGLQAVDVCGVLADCVEYSGEELSL